MRAPRREPLLLETQRGRCTRSGFELDEDSQYSRLKRSRTFSFFSPNQVGGGRSAPTWGESRTGAVMRPAAGARSVVRDKEPKTTLSIRSRGAHRASDA